MIRRSIRINEYLYNQIMNVAKFYHNSIQKEIIELLEIRLIYRLRIDFDDKTLDILNKDK